MPKKVDVTAAEGGNEVQAEVQQEVAVAVQLQQQVEEQVEEVVETTIPDAGEVGGATEMVGGFIMHETLNTFASTPARELDTLGVSLYVPQIWTRYGDPMGYFLHKPVRSLRQHIGCFDPRIFIGAMYEGRLENDAISGPQAANFGNIGKRDNRLNNSSTKRAQAVLHSERLPINEALFVKDPVGGVEGRV